MALPLADESVDGVVISFGLRNVADPDAALREFRRVTRPGGTLVICEFSSAHLGAVPHGLHRVPDEGAPADRPGGQQQPRGLRLPRRVHPGLARPGRARRRGCRTPAGRTSPGRTSPAASSPCTAPAAPEHPGTSSPLTGGSFRRTRGRRFAACVRGFRCRSDDRPLGGDDGPVRPGGRPSRLSEVLPVAGWSPAQKAMELGRSQRSRSVLAAYEAELVVGLAADRPDALDRRRGQSGRLASGGPMPSPIPGTCGVLRRRAGGGHQTARGWRRGWRGSRHDAGGAAAGGVGGAGRRPAGPAAGAGVPRRAGGPVPRKVCPAAVAAAVLPEAGELSVGRLRARSDGAAGRPTRRPPSRRRAEGGAGRRCAAVRRPVHGMGELRARPAAAGGGGDPGAGRRPTPGRQEGRRRAADRAAAGVALRRLILAPGTVARPPVTARTGGGRGAGHAGVRGRRGAGHGPGAGAGGRRTGDGRAGPGAAGTAGRGVPGRAAGPDRRQPDALGHRRRRAAAGGADPPGAGGARRGCAHHRTRLGCAVLAGRRRGPVRPSPAQQRFARPGTAPAGIPAAATRPAGPTWTTCWRTPTAAPTDCANLCCLCRRHHRLKTHAPGWRFVMTARRRAAGDHPERHHPDHPTAGHDRRASTTGAASATAERQPRPTNPHRSDPTRT